MTETQGDLRAPSMSPSPHTCAWAQGPRVEAVGPPLQHCLLDDPELCSSWEFPSLGKGEEGDVN